MADAPRLSLVGPAYRRSLLVPAVVTAVLPQLESGGELLVVDDWSGDETPATVRAIHDAGLRSVTQTNPRAGSG